MLIVLYSALWGFALGLVCGRGVTNNREGAWLGAAIGTIFYIVLYFVTCPAVDMLYNFPTMALFAFIGTNLKSWLRALKKMSGSWPN